ncbi:hypothetical protein JRO89_XS07G0294500 [Xanthoceras sorbifolium]|uniref:Alpha/beta hydrolase fold-3 domain-containing protein n=1 Tax=Xanthoceras sorbifolium TaxID=99658 RepID=A0ABQ8HW02_9ROSI|nr:hypothetical protein JRO89_XS07G0294500 [Xanthoceras sorbifolium]
MSVDESQKKNPKTSPNLPWKTKLFLSTFSFFTDVVRRSNFTVNRRLFNLIDTKSPPSKKPINGVSSSDVIVDASKNLWFRVYTPVGVSDVGLPVVVYLHGGGFTFLAANSKPYDDFCMRLARELPAVVVSVNYRLSPEHKYPAQYEDGFDVLKFLDREKIDNFPGFANLSNCFLAGDSAGGNIAHHMALRASDFSFQKLKLVGLIAIQPFFGGEEQTESELRLVGVPVVSVERTEWIWKAFLPEGSDRDHPASNVFGPNSVDLSEVNFPATIVVVGGFDPLQDWQRRYYEGLKKSGKDATLVEYPEAVHSFYGFPELPESSLLIKETRDFMQRLC